MNRILVVEVLLVYFKGKYSVSCGKKKIKYEANNSLTILRIFKVIFKDSLAQEQYSK